MTTDDTLGIDLGQMTTTGRATVLEALKALDKTGMGVLLICDESGVLRSLVTDGDVRRFLIRGGALDDTIAAAASEGFFSVAPNTSRDEVAGLMMRQGYNAIPEVDAQGKLVHLHTLRDTVLRSVRSAPAVIMAGGRGERLGELTQAIPKPMLPVGGRPILERLVTQLVTHGFRRIFISVNYLAPMVRDHFGDGSAFNADISYLEETTPLGTGGSLALIPNLKETCLVMNGDLVTGLNFSRLHDFHVKGGYGMTVALRDHLVRIPYGVAELEGRTIQSMKEKPAKSYLVNAGIYAIEPELIASIPRDVAFPITELIPTCRSIGQSVGGYRMDEDWVDVGLVDEYERAQGAG